MSGVKRFEVEEGDVEGALEVYRRINRLADEVVAELEKRGFTVKLAFQYIVKRQEVVIVGQWEVVTSTEMEVHLGVFTRDGKRYSVPLARLTRDLTSRAAYAEVYSVEKALSEMREVRIEQIFRKE
jgi:tRNA nucleotidyltransferase (CCA-adding enzyme)